MSSLMEAILKNQLRHVSLAVSFTSSTENGSKRYEGKETVPTVLQGYQGVFFFKHGS